MTNLRLETATSKVNYADVCVECCVYFQGITDKSLTGEPILPSQTANQYRARYWFAVSPAKMVHRLGDLSDRTDAFRKETQTQPK